MVCIIVQLENEKYSCEEVDGYESKIVRLVINEYMIYKDYIKNLHNFLNTKRNDNWPTWIIGHVINCANDNGYCVKINKYSIDIGYNSTRINTIKITNPRNPQNPQNNKFIEFINRRFLLKHICNKYNVPKDIHLHLINFF